MEYKPSYEALEKRIEQLEKENARLLKDEDVLQDRGSSFSQLFESAPVPMAYATKSGGYRGTTWNACWYETFGYDRAEADGRSGADIGLWVDPEDRFRLIELAKRQNYAAHFETLLRRKDGQIRHCSLFGRFIEVTCNRLLMVIYFDITEKVRMEKMMIQSEKMLSLGGLAAGMAHELNNPLAGMIQTANLMANRLDAGLEIPASVRAAREAGTSLEAVQRFMASRGILTMIDNIRNAGQRAAGIVKNMLNFSRKSDGTMTPHDPAELVEKTIRLAQTDYDLKNHYDFKAIKIVKDYAPDLPSIPCHDARIQQVLLNLLRNGAQAMQEKADGLDGYAPQFTVRLVPEKASQMLRIEVEDNGPGMDDKTCKRAFDPFFTTKPVGVGTGLGLSISYFIITESHGGQMRVESVPGSGATFIIHLPSA